MLLFHEVCHSSKIYLLIEGLKLENGILKEVGSNESDVFACLSTRRMAENGFAPPLGNFADISYLVEN